MAYRTSISALREMPPRHDGIDGGDQFRVRRHFQQGRVIADPENDAGLRRAPRLGRGATPHEKAAYQFEFTEIGWPRGHVALLGGPAVLVRPQFLGGPIQNGIDEFMSIRRTELLGQLHRLRQRHSIRQFGT